MNKTLFEQEVLKMNTEVCLQGSRLLCLLWVLPVHTRFLLFTIYSGGHRNWPLDFKCFLLHFLLAYPNDLMFSYFSLRKVDMFFGITHVIGSNIKEVMIGGRKKVEVGKINYLFAVIMNLNVS